MKHHRVLFAIIWVLCACCGWFPLFVRLAKSGMPSSGDCCKIVRMLVPSDCPKFSGKDSTQLAVTPLTPADCVCGQVVTQGPSNGVIIPLDSLDHRTGLFARSIPSWDNTSTLELGRTKGHFCKTINPAYPPFVPPITFPPIRLRQVAPYRSPRKLLSSKTYHSFARPTDPKPYLPHSPHVHEPV